MLVAPWALNAARTAASPHRDASRRSHQALMFEESIRRSRSILEGLPVNFRQLECFFAVAEHLHFGRAAASLHLAPASVSEAVQGLERHLGAELFVRTTRRVSLTTFGSDFLMASRPAWEELNRAYGMARGGLRHTSEVLLAHTPELGHLVLPRLAADAPGHGSRGDRGIWRPVAMHTHEQMESLAKGKVDLGLCWIPAVRAPLVATPLARCPFVVIAPEGDPLAAREDLQLSDLRGRRIVVSSRQVNLFIDAKLQLALLQSGMSFSSLDEVDGYDEIALLVAARGDIGIHPASIVGVNRVPGLVFRPLAEPDLDVEICAMHRIADTDRLSDLIEALRRVTVASVQEVLTTLEAPAG